MNKLKEIKSKITRLEKILGNLENEYDKKKEPFEKELSDLELLRMQIEYGLKIGDTIPYQNKQYKICGFDTYWPRGSLVKKDGTVSTVVHNLYIYPRKIE